MRLLALLAALAVAPAAHGARLPPATPAGQVVFYGHIRSLTPSGGRYLLRLDPAFPLTGVTAHDAAQADLPAGVPLVDGFYARDESHALLTLLVPRSARATVVAKGPVSTRVSVAELAQLLAGKNPKHRRLLAPAAAYAYWIRVDGDVVQSLDAQYRP